MKRSRWLLGLAVFAVLIAAFVLGRSGSTPGASRDREETVTSKYDFVAHGVDVRQTGVDGQLQYRLEAARIEQRPGDRQVSATDLTAHYDAPAGTTGPLAESRWTMTAASAVLPRDGQLLQLRGDVQVSGLLPEARAPVTMSTPSLDYNLETQELTSDDLVDMRMGAMQLQGQGLQANIRMGTLELESQVHGVIAR
jgi:LPS export ABC transporter protein LptC